MFRRNGQKSETELSQKALVLLPHVAGHFRTPFPEIHTRGHCKRYRSSKGSYQLRFYVLNPRSSAFIRVLNLPDREPDLQKTSHTNKMQNIYGGFQCNNYMTILQLQNMHNDR